MRFGFSSNAFRDHSAVEAIEVLADAGYDGVELLFDEPHLYPPEATADAVDAVRAALDDAGIDPCNGNAFMLTAIGDFHHPSFVEPDAADRRRRVEYTLAALDLAAALDVPHISVEPGGPVPDGKDREWAFDVFEAGLREVLDRADEVGVDVLVEPEPGLLLESSSDFLELRRRVDADRLGCNFDAGHLFCVGEDPVDAYDRLAGDVAHVHLEDIPADRAHEHTQLGEGAMDVDGFLAALADRDYEGFVTVELYPYRETAGETAREAMAYLRERGWA